MPFCLEFSQKLLRLDWKIIKLEFGYSVFDNQIVHSKTDAIQILSKSKTAKKTFLKRLHF